MKAKTSFLLSAATFFFLSNANIASAYDGDHDAQSAENKYVYTTYGPDGNIVNPHTKMITSKDGYVTRHFDHNKAVVRPGPTHHYDAKATVVSKSIKIYDGPPKNPNGHSIKVDADGTRWVDGVKQVDRSHIYNNDKKTQVAANKDGSVRAVNYDKDGHIKALMVTKKDGSVRPFHFEIDEHAKVEGRKLCKAKNQTGFFSVDSKFGNTTCFTLIRPQDTKPKDLEPAVSVADTQDPSDRTDCPKPAVSY